MPQPSSTSTFEQARRLHESGDLTEAERLYIDILRGDRLHFDALHMLGMLYYQRGALDRALACLRAALQIDAVHADAQSLSLIHI